MKTNLHTLVAQYLNDDAYAYLTEKANGVPRVQRLSWERLAKFYTQGDRRIRRLIANEARRCGYTTSTIVALNAR